MPTTIPESGSHRRKREIVAFCREHGVHGLVTYATIWVRTHGQADDLTTLLAREWDGVYPQPTVGVRPFYGADGDHNAGA
jgi:hypothetical protein